MALQISTPSKVKGRSPVRRSVTKFADGNAVIGYPGAGVWFNTADISVAPLRGCAGIILTSDRKYGIPRQVKINTKPFSLGHYPVSHYGDCESIYIIIYSQREHGRELNRRP
jgi:hypothetical protein